MPASVAPAADPFLFELQIAPTTGVGKLPLKYSQYRTPGAILVGLAACLIGIVGLSIVATRVHHTKQAPPAPAKAESDFLQVADRFARLSADALPDIAVSDIRYDVTRTQSLVVPLRGQLQFDAVVKLSAWVPRTEQIPLPFVPLLAKIRYMALYDQVDNQWRFTGDLSADWIDVTFDQDPGIRTVFAQQIKRRIDEWARRELVGRTVRHDASRTASVSRDQYRANALKFRPSSQDLVSGNTDDNGKIYLALYDIMHFLGAVTSPQLENVELPLYKPHLADRVKVARFGNMDERSSAIADLGTLGPDAISVLSEIALARKPDVSMGVADNDLERCNAINSLKEIGPQCIPTLIKALDDTSLTVQFAAAEGLSSFGGQAKEAVPNLQSLIRESAFGSGEFERALLRIDPSARVPQNKYNTSNLPAEQLVSPKGVDEETFRRYQELLRNPRDK